MSVHARDRGCVLKFRPVGPQCRRQTLATWAFTASCSDQVPRLSNPAAGNRRAILRPRGEHDWRQPRGTLGMWMRRLLSKLHERPQHVASKFFHRPDSTTVLHFTHFRAASPLPALSNRRVSGQIGREESGDFARARRTTALEVSPRVTLQGGPGEDTMPRSAGEPISATLAEADRREKVRPARRKAGGGRREAAGAERGLPAVRKARRQAGRAKFRRIFARPEVPPMGIMRQRRRQVANIALLCDGAQHTNGSAFDFRRAWP